jgi:pimeloyl-ACP methyl ester carboxylesterase
MFRAIRRSLLALLPSLALAAPVVPAGAADAGQAITWRDCGGGVRCGHVTVPADWSRSDRSQTIEIGLGKLPAADPERRLGTLLVDEGGPAAEVDLLRTVPAVRDQLTELTRWFDVVLFDPRGMGESSGVSCPTPAPVPGLAWASPDRSDFVANAADNRSFAVGCRQAMGSLRGRLDSWQVAHDMDAIRAALGESRLAYFGNSYGTVFGQAYAALFGSRISRMYLDSVFDHTQPDLYAWTAPRAETTEDNLHRFASWCDQDAACALHGRDAVAALDRVVAAATRQPIPAPASGPGVTASASLIESRVAGVIGGESAWPALAAWLAAADAGDASSFVRPPCTDQAQCGLGVDMTRFMFCADFPYASTYRALRRVDGELRERVAPHLGWTQVWTTQAVLCPGLPDAAGFPPRSIRLQAPIAPVLLADGSHDSTTPPAYGRRVAAQLPGARFLLADGSHALYLGGNACVRGYVDSYLIGGPLPPPDTTCPR